jgi:tetratricopeptide (TPR) repeat protein
MSTAHPPLPDSYEGLHNRAQALVRRGQIEDSIAHYRRLTDRLGRLSDPILARRRDLRDLHRQARLEFAGLLTAEGRYAEALEVEQVLLRTDPDEAARWRRDLAVLRAAKGEVESGLAELRSLAEEDPDQPEGWMLLAQEARIAGRFAESQRALDRALAACQAEDADTLAEIHYQRFLLFKEMKRLDEALAAWEEAAHHDPELSKTVREVYTMLTDVGRFTDAQRYVKKDDNALQAGFQQGLIASLTGRPIDAREAWQQVSALNPDDFEYGHDAWVEAVLRLRDPDPALEWLQGALPAVGTPRLLILSGIGWAMRQDGELAAVLFQQAINLLRRERPPKRKLDSADWRLLDSLIQDDALKTDLKPYFAIVETLW